MLYRTTLFILSAHQSETCDRIKLSGFAALRKKRRGVKGKSISVDFQS